MATVGALLDVLGSVLHPVTGSLGFDNVVTELVLIGPGDPIPEVAGAALLYVGDRDVPTDLCGVQASVVIGKPCSIPDGSWDESTVPVLLADEQTPWHHLQQLINTAIHTGAGGQRVMLGDLFSLVSSIAQAIGAATSIEDPHQRVLAYSSVPGQPIDDARQQGILGRQVPDFAVNDAEYQAVRRAPAAVRIPARGTLQPRLAIAVRSGADLLGYIWVINVDDSLPSAAEEALVGASQLAAMHLLHIRTAGAAERRARGDLLGSLLDARSAPELVGERLGLDVDTRIAIMGLRVGDNSERDSTRDEIVADLAAIHCRGVEPRSAVHVHYGIVYVLMPASHLTRSQLVDLGHRIAERARTALRERVTVAVGATRPSLHEIAESRADVDATLRIIDAGSVVAVEDVLPQVMLLAIKMQLMASPRLRLPVIERIYEHDREHGTSYAETALTYLAHGDVSSAAAALTLHHNSLRYRLARVQELFHLDLADPDIRLTAWLQLRIDHLGDA
ncbi:PucR family transcriptional regulator [Amycolatopsis pigmentata]|uniref:PucR family transcriptional regulator n=1 Tax=Amycolatopsis pigmentata TaxID=450801 RepID=A0ABW5FLB4_9PSEU